MIEHCRRSDIFGYALSVSTRQSTVDFLLEQLRAAGAVRARKMFGEYALYCDEKVVALVCDDRLFVKPTEQGRAFLGSVEEAPPYPGSKPFFVIEEDRDWMTKLVSITALALPVPKRKKSSVKK